jgi:hypothetical protein
MQGVTFIGADTGRWSVQRITAWCGATLPVVSAVERIEGAGDQPFGLPAAPATGRAWALHGFRSNERYTHAGEKRQLVAAQEGLDRVGATCAALIPIRKSAAWWALAQDERREIFEAQSRHIAIGLEYLPAIARRLYHCRDLGEPFDFLTWFEFAPTEAPRFDGLLARLRSSPEWAWVERDVEVRLSSAAVRSPAGG